MQVHEAMTRDVRVATADETIEQAARLMVGLDAGALPVGENNRLVGMITDRDIAVRGVAEGHGPDTPVRELMTNDMVTAREDDDVDDVAARMSQAQVRRLPVIDDQERLCGIVSLGDLSQQGEDDAAEQALEGITEPGGKHQQ
jgi:CBS domain-containing protein